MAIKYWELLFGDLIVLDKHHCGYIVIKIFGLCAFIGLLGFLPKNAYHIGTSPCIVYLRWLWHVFCASFVMMCRVFFELWVLWRQGGSCKKSKFKGSSSQKGNGKEKESTNLDYDVTWFTGKIEKKFYNRVIFFKEKLL